jgi:hypothetical protein
VERSESARIVEGEAMAGCREDHMVMAVKGIGVEAEAAGHAEVEEERIPPVGGDEAIFGAAGDPGDGRALETLPEVGGDRPAKVRAARFDRGQPLAFEERREAAHDGFDFGEFGHVAMRPS